MDIGKLAATEKIYEMRHPTTGEPLGIKLVMVALEDASMRKLRREISNRSEKLRMRGKTFTAEEVEANWLALLFAAVQGWDWYGDVDFNGSKPQFTRDNFVNVCTTLPWFRDQIDSEVSEYANFISA